MSRTWGYWTRGKLDVLRDYLDAFTTATKKSTERIYLDLFAGETDNRDRITNEAIRSSAQIALAIDDPPFTKLGFFELEGKAQELESALLATHPTRKCRVYAGDCNEQTIRSLTQLRRLSWAPTFAFIDPNGLEAKWGILEQLANFRSNGRKTELFLLFSPQMFSRLLPVKGNQLRPEDEQAISHVFGTTEWRFIYDMRLNGSLSGQEAREEYLNLMRWRLETVLGYKWTHPLELKNTRGTSLYFMVFATSNEVGHRIMSHLYDTSAKQFPAMQSEAKSRLERIQEEQTGVMRLFTVDPGPTVSESQDDRFYAHEPPSRPSFLKDKL